MVRGSLTLGSSTSFSFRDEHGAQLCYHDTSWTTALDKYKCFMPAKFFCFFNHGLFTLSEVNMVPVGRTNHSFS